MNDTYTTIGQNLYNFMANLDISTVAANWGVKLNRLPKSDEINVYPAYAVTPARDVPPDMGDTMTDFDSIYFSVFVIVSAHGGDEAETRLRALADIVRTNLRPFRNDATGLHAQAYNMTFSGEWGGNADQGERWYRVDVTVNLYETLEAQ